jgi:hypothetical protein
MEPQYAIFGKTAGWGRGQFGSDNTMPVDRNRKPRSVSHSGLEAQAQVASQYCVAAAPLPVQKHEEQVALNVPVSFPLTPLVRSSKPLPGPASA